MVLITMDLENILRNQGMKNSTSFAGLDYISLCDYEKRKHFNGKVPFYIQNYNSYNSYILKSLALCFDKEKLDAIEPIMVDYVGTLSNGEGYKIMKEYGLKEERYSDLADEVQIKDKVSLEHLVELTFPTISFFNESMYFTKSSKIKALINEIKRIEELLKEYNYNVPIYDIDTKQLMTEENIEKIVLSLK